MRLLRLATNLLLAFWCWQCHLAGVMLLYSPQFQQQSQQQRQLSAQQQQQQQQQQQTQLISNSTLDQAITSMFLAQGGANGTSLIGNQIVLKIRHNDAKNNALYVDILPVNYTNLHEPRMELRYQSKYPFVSIDERTPNNTVVAAVVVNDEDSGQNGETSLSIEHGNELGHFKLVSTSFTNTIQVNGAPLSKLRVPEYNLTIVARDHGSPPKSSAVNLVIKLNTNAPLEPQPSLKPPVTDLMYVGTMLVVIFSLLILFIIIGCALVQRPKSKKGTPRMLQSDHCLCPLNLRNI